LTYEDFVQPNAEFGMQYELVLEVTPASTPTLVGRKVIPFSFSEYA
jgi:hypothetical protein